jgi:NADH-quinone oxidoreductase subunit D
VPRRGQLIRVLYSEIGRICRTCLNITTQALDVGALTPPLWGFEEREKLMVFYERASGSADARSLFPPRRCSPGPAAGLIDDIDTGASSSCRC